MGSTHVDIVGQLLAFGIIAENICCPIVAGHSNCKSAFLSGSIDIIVGSISINRNDVLAFSDNFGISFGAFGHVVGILGAAGALAVCVGMAGGGNGLIDCVSLFSFAAGAVATTHHAILGTGCIPVFHSHGIVTQGCDWVGVGLTADGASSGLLAGVGTGGSLGLNVAAGAVAIGGDYLRFGVATSGASSGLFAGGGAGGSLGLGVVAHGVTVFCYIAVFFMVAAGAVGGFLTLFGTGGSLGLDVRTHIVAQGAGIHCIGNVALGAGVTYTTGSFAGCGGAIFHKAVGAVRRKLEVDGDFAAGSHVARIIGDFQNNLLTGT